MTVDGPARARSLPRMLFVSHEASRTGAPMVLLHLLRWIRAHSPMPFEVLLLAGGPLAAEFAALAPTHVLSARGRGSLTYLEQGMARAGLPWASDRLRSQRLRLRARHLSGFDGLYLNSATSALALRILPEVPPVVISHLHEMRSALTYWFPPLDRDAMLRATDRFIACSQAVVEDLAGGFGIERSRIGCHYEFIDPPRVDAASAAAARRWLGIPPDALVVGAAGHVIWRKGADLFLQTAAEVLRRRPDLDVHFVWVGDTDSSDFPAVRHDLERLDVAGRVHFTGELSEPSATFANFDLFCLTSREDPFPLVMLEAASLGVPVLSFANGGAVEFAEGVGGQPAARIVRYLDVEAMAASVVDLLDHPAERRALGQAGHARVHQLHTVKTAVPHLYEEILSMTDHGDEAAA